MTHFPDSDAGVIRFISSTQTAVIEPFGLGEGAAHVVVFRGHDMHAD